MSEYYESKDYQSAEFKHSDDVEWTPVIEPVPDFQFKIGNAAVRLSREDTSVVINTHNPEIDHILIERNNKRNVVFREQVTNFDETMVAMAQADFRFDDAHVATEGIVAAYITFKTHNLDEQWKDKSKEWGDNG